VLATLLLVGGAWMTQGPTDAFGEVASEVRRGITRGLYPGAVVVVGRRDSILYAEGFGHFTWDRRSHVPKPAESFWDLASLTKVVATTTAAAVLVERGRLDLDAPVGTYLPAFAGGGRSAVTVRMLLDHTSGLPPYLPFFRWAGSRRAAVDSVFAAPLDFVPGDTARYSDLNAILLGFIVEAVAGEPLDQFTQREIFAPIGMHLTLFRPADSLRPRIVPAREEGGKPIPGLLSDQNAVALGGVAGHAGLFSTGLDLARFAQVWLAAAGTPEGPLLQMTTVHAFLEHGPRSGSRLLGWDSPDSVMVHPSVFGSLSTRTAFGHTGWTGTLLWMDPARDLFVVFLTNRSLAPKRRNSIVEMREVRSRVSDAAIRATGLPCEAVATSC
jgi:CubicO group peptidase (beta-lactamase class C family)